MAYTQITKTRDSGAEFSVIGAHNPRTLEHIPVIGLVPAVRASDSALVSPKELDVKIFSALIDDDDPRQKKLKEIFAPNVTAKELHQARSLKFTLFEKMLMDTLNNPSGENSVAGTAASPQFTISGKNSYEISFPGFNITKQGSRETTESNVDVVLAAFVSKDHLDSLNLCAFLSIIILAAPHIR